VRLLPDTHSFLWFISGDPQLSERARGLIEDRRHSSALSVASLWEIAIKVSIGKLALTEDFATFIPRELQSNSIQILPIEVEHLAKLSRLPQHHRDPFDRLLISQALVEQMPVIGCDGQFDAYGVPRKW
jgi:PIN domain nuclease of toxin-antitoxin system